MDRNEWLKERRQEADERYSTWWAPRYWKTFGFYPNETHLQFIQKFKDHLPKSSAVLDAACGAGRYMPEFIGKGFTVMGIDQSEAMLARAKEMFPDVKLEKIGLQEMPFQETFDGAICMDAVENVCPEDWPVVVANFQRALKPGGYLYFTVEMADPAEVKAAFDEAHQAGLPVVYGEWANGEVYHYYPSLERVRDWVQQAGLVILEEGEGNGYHHFLMQKV